MSSASAMYPYTMTLLKVVLGRPRPLAPNQANLQQLLSYENLIRSNSCEIRTLQRLCRLLFEWRAAKDCGIHLLNVICSQVVKLVKFCLT